MVAMKTEYPKGGLITGIKSLDDRWLLSRGYSISRERYKQMKSNSLQVAAAQAIRGWVNLYILFPSRPPTPICLLEREK